VKPLEHLLHWFGPTNILDELRHVVLGLITALVTWACRQSFKKWLTRRPKLVNATVLIEGRCEVRAACKGTLTASNDWWI
jgi:hypothetical protein